MRSESHVVEHPGQHRVVDRGIGEFAYRFGGPQGVNELHRAILAAGAGRHNTGPCGRYRSEMWARNGTLVTYEAP